MPSTDPAEIEAEIARTRAALQATVDELTDRLHPRNQAQHAVEEAKIALADIKRRVSGEARLPDEPEPSRTGWAVLGAGALAAAAVVAVVVRKS